MHLHAPRAIDCHHHFVPSALFDDLERYTAPGITVTRARDYIDFGYGDQITRMSATFSDLPAQIADLDAARNPNRNSFGEHSAIVAELGWREAL